MAKQKIENFLQKWEKPKLILFWFESFNQSEANIWAKDNSLCMKKNKKSLKSW